MNIILTIITAWLTAGFLASIPMSYLTKREPDRKDYIGLSILGPASWLLVLNEWISQR